MGEMTKNDLTDAAIHVLRAHGCTVFVTRSSRRGSYGLPQYYCLGADVTAFIKFKANAKPLDLMQKSVCDSMLEHGQAVAVVRLFKDGTFVIEDTSGWALHDPEGLIMLPDALKRHLSSKD